MKDILQYIVVPIVTALITAVITYLSTKVNNKTKMELAIKDHEIKLQELNNEMLLKDKEIEQLKLNHELELQSKEADIARLLACILIPKGHKYNTDYDLEAFINQIEINLNIYDAESMLFFYIIESLRLLKRSHKVLMMKAMGKKLIKKMGFKF